MLGIGGVSGYFLGRDTSADQETAQTGIQKFTATRGSVSIVEFPDGTRVWLNSESYLTYYENFHDEQPQHKLLTSDQPGVHHFFNIHYT